jgi:plastocyanin
MPRLRLLAVAALLIGAGCSGSSTGYGGNPPPAPPPPPPPPPAPGATLAVSVADAGYNPANGSVQSAGTVTWTWNGTLTHNVTFEDGQSNSPSQADGTHSRQFPTVTGSTTFRYRCTFHSTNFTSGMSGQVVVTP